MDVISEAGLLNTVTGIQGFEEEVVYEFWANLPSVRVEGDSVKVLVRGFECEFSPAKINALFYMQHVRARTQRIQTAGLVDEEVARYLTDGRIQNLQNIPMNKFSENCKSLFKISCRNCLPKPIKGMQALTEEDLSIASLTKWRLILEKWCMIMFFN